MWKKVKNLDLFIRVVDSNTNMYVCYPPQYHRDYMSFTLTFSFEDWSYFHNDGKTHIEITASYRNAKGQYLVKFQDGDFDKLCEKIKVWNDTHRTELNADIVLQICNEQKSTQDIDYVSVDESLLIKEEEEEQNQVGVLQSLYQWFLKKFVKE